MEFREIQDKLNAYDRVIQSEKRISRGWFKAVCVLYILEFVLCALGMVSMKISVNILELTAIIGLCITVYIDNQVQKSTLLYKNEVINLSLKGEDVYCEYFSKRKFHVENNCINRKSFIWIHFFILVLSFTMNFAITLDLDLESSKVENSDVIINNTVVLPNDSTIIIR